MRLYPKILLVSFFVWFFSRSRLRPPVFGPRRDRMMRQAGTWGAARLEVALTMLTDTDLQLRSAGQHAPAMELVERTLIRLAMLARR